MATTEKKTAEMPVFWRVHNTFLELAEDDVSRTPAIRRTRSEQHLLDAPNDESACAEVAKPEQSACACTEDPQQFRDASADSSGEVAMTTVYVSDLPCKVGCERMMTELEALGLDGCYDLLRFPVKSSRGKESFKGYGFINFKTEDAAAFFMSAFEGHRFKDIDSNKAVRVEYAREQGVPSAIAGCSASFKKRRYRSCRVDLAGLTVAAPLG
eukprot:TRINITY_DN12811_c0_g4_i1.p1 TRINITY_DN12811_c0_g4~~TRINITY_DN12811_c0_g4_i1.p1  ORF type:complete len:212 (+),score=31.77 TRINITY_DN12811_c0_g4_i1:72-707(+)